MKKTTYHSFIFIITLFFISSLNKLPTKKIYNNLYKNINKIDTLIFEEKYKIELSRFYEQRDYEDRYNSVFTLLKKTNMGYQKIYQDSIFCFTNEILLEDFNNDGIEDILIQNRSDVRSNLSYYLYLVDTLNNQLHKVKNFEEIKNPVFNKKNNLITNYVLSGTNWTSFYKIDKDSIKDLGITIYDSDNSKYDKEYKKAIHKINSLTN